MRGILDKMIEILCVFAYLTEEWMHISIKSSYFANESAKELQTHNIIMQFAVWFACRNCVKTKNKKQTINCA